MGLLESIYLELLTSVPRIANISVQFSHRKPEIYVL